MSMECGECERDLRGGHDVTCSRHIDAVRRIRSEIERDQEEYTNGDAALLMREVDALTTALRESYEVLEYLVKTNGHMMNRDIVASAFLNSEKLVTRKIVA